MIGFFYGQTEYNYLENSISLEKYVSYCTEYGFDYITITDKNMHAYYKFYNLCLKNNIKPIIGLKVQLSNDFNLLVYAKNNNGLKNLFKLSKLQEINKKVDFDQFNSLNEDIFVVIPDDCIIYKNINSSEFDAAILAIKKIDSIVFLGVNGNEDVNLINNFTSSSNIRPLPMCNVNYVLKGEFKVYETLSKIGNNKTRTNHSHIINKLEYDESFNNYNFDLDFINEISYSLDEKIELPSYSNDISDSGLYLNDLSTKGLQRRLQLNNKISSYDKYLVRLQYELKVINQMGYDNYFLIVWDLIKYAKKEGILVGPGRGSAAGSLVSYCLGITEIDPLEYDLYFERFLNPDRISMPDIDIDFPDNKREDVIQYVKDKYGDNHVCYISAFNTFGVKSSIRDICRVNNVNLDHATLMLKHVDDFGLDDAIEKYASRQDLLEVLTITNKISGLIRHISTHAAGIILSSVNLDDFIPLRQGVNGVYQSQLEGQDLEKLGFLKIDFLGIRNLALIDNMTKEIETINLRDIPLNDKKTFELLQKGDTNGIFQLESSGIRNVLKKLKPTTFDDVVSVLALYRPGPMDNIDAFIEGKKTGKIKYNTNELKPILNSTYGIIVYQEQIMEIANVVSGYTYAEADLLRRAVSKKDKEILDENRRMFVSKAGNKGFSEKISNEIYDLIVKFADYGFNKSHSVAYAKLSYEMAYIKSNFPIVFISEMINNSIGDDSEVMHYINYAKSKGIDVVTPKINHSNTNCVIIKNRILLPFNVIHKLGNNTSKLIVDERNKSKFESFDDFKDRTKNFVNISIITNLIFSNSFDEFKKTKKSMNSQKDTNNSFAKFVTDSIVDDVEYDFDFLKQMEYDALGYNVNYNIFRNSKTTISKYKVIESSDQLVENKNILVAAYIENIRSIETKNKEAMSFVTLDLDFCKISGVVFPKLHSLFLNLDMKKLVLIEAGVQKRNEELQLVVNKIKNI